jgi:hypothetical protein
MAMTNDLALTVYAVSPGGNDFGGDRDIRVGQTNPVKCQFQIPLANEVPRFFVRLEASPQVTPSREYYVAELLQAAQVADDRITNAGSRGGKTWFVESAVEKRPGGHENVLCPCTSLEPQKHK